MEIKDYFDAKRRIDGILHKNPLEYSKYFSDISGANVYLKCENRQKTGSFKVRGAYNRIVRLMEGPKKPKAVVACSMGNHAQAVAFGATSAGIKSTIVMPKCATAVKIEATKGYGAEVVLHGETYGETIAFAMQLAKDTGAVYVPGFDCDDIITGAGTCGLEILEDLINVNTIIIPVGGGGLLAGVAYAVKHINPRVRIVGVQAAGATAMLESFNKGEIITKTAKTIADGIAVQTPGAKPFEVIRQFVDEIVSVTDDEIENAIVKLLERCKQVAEPSGAASLAALCSGKLDLRGQNVVCIVSGGNINLELIRNILTKKLA